MRMISILFCDPLKALEHLSEFILQFASLHQNHRISCCSDLLRPHSQPANVSTMLREEEEQGTLSPRCTRPEPPPEGVNELRAEPTVSAALDKLVRGSAGEVETLVY